MKNKYEHTYKNGPYVFVSEKGILLNRDPEMGRYYSLRNDGSLYDPNDKEELRLAIEALAPVLDRLVEYDRNNGK